MKQYRISIIGPGVVGQATGKVLQEKGFLVTFFGVDPQNIQKLRKDGYQAYLKEEIYNGNYNYDITFLTVPTPTLNGQIDLSAMEEASIDLGKHLRHQEKYHLVVVKSTVLPGTTEGLVIKNIEKYSGKKVGREFGICMNPEYLREETAYNDMLNPWLIVIGEYDQRSGQILDEVYQSFNCPIHHLSLKEAEIQKYIHNLFNAAKISFFNEMRSVGEGLGLDIEKVFQLVVLSAEGIWNPSYGTKNKGPYSGKCLPKDTQAFLYWANQQNFSTELLKAVITVNNSLVEKGEKDQGESITASPSPSLPL